MTATADFEVEALLADAEEPRFRRRRLLYHVGFHDGVRGARNPHVGLEVSHEVIELRKTIANALNRLGILGLSRGYTPTRSIDLPPVRVRGPACPWLQPGP